MADEKADQPQAGFVTIDVASRLLMLTPVRIRQLVAEGHIPKAARNQYNLVGLVQGYIKFLRDEDRRSTKNAAENSLKVARQREVELRIAVQTRALIELSEHYEIVDELLGLLIAGLSSLPARVTKDIALRRTIETECDRIRSDLSKRSEEKARDLAESREVSQAEPTYHS